ncbi:MULTISPECIES: hypothetical protein [unclassified Mesorhizobium]|uniref:hypothetical protein n=1 Tax=Mesorhizobium sp. B2-3-12 TaxID=2589952 RepID=UPI001FEEBE24|nr:MULTISPECIES: hypothetical protein [unclassified Mesorhizobium]
MPIKIGHRQRSGAEVEFARTAVNDNVNRIQAVLAAQRVRDLLRSWQSTAKKNRLNAGPHARDEHWNIGDRNINEDDFFCP